MKGSFKTALIAAVVSAFVAAGAAVATTKTFVLGTTNTVDAASTLDRRFGAERADASTDQQHHRRVGDGARPYHPEARDRR